MGQEVFEGARRNLRIGRLERLRGMVTDAAIATANEQHPHGGERRHHHRIVSGTARQASRRRNARDTSDALGPACLHARVTGNRVDLEHFAPLSTYMPSRPDAPEFRDHIIESSTTDLIIAGANIEAQLASTRD